MSRSILSFLGGWWVRLIDRAGAEPEPVARATAEPPPTKPGKDAAPSAAKGAPAATDVERSFREMVLFDVRRADTGGALKADPELCARTLAALADLKQIPALQSLAQGFMQTAGRSDVAVDEIVASIEKDSALCVRVLGMANSVEVASEQRVEDLATAVHLLGVVRVRRLAQALFTLRDSQRIAEGLDWRHLWIHAFATAAIAEELERRLRPTAESQIHLAALLHDVGKIVLSMVAADAYREIVVVAWNGEGRLEDLERRWLGVSHREAGVVFAERNGLPAIAIAAIAHHADPEAAGAHRFEVALVALANYLSKAHGLGFSGARLDASDGEFAEQPAWRVIAEEGGGVRVTPDEIEAGIGPFIAGLRVELKGLREAG